jgi:NADH-quinone oxidoreductase subunit L
MYMKGAISPKKMGERFKALYTVLYNKWYFDEIYDATIIKPILAFTRGLWSFDGGIIDWIVNAFGNLTVWFARLKQWFDEHIVDGAVNGIGFTIWGFGAILRQVQTGKVQFYGFAIVFGLVVILLMRVI